jgi:hypothetical protein
LNQGEQFPLAIREPITCILGLAFINIRYIFGIICRADKNFDSLDIRSILAKNDYDYDPNYLLKHQQARDDSMP